MRILVTGAAGFIGSHLMDAFDENAQGIDIFLTSAPRSDVHKVDVADRKHLYWLANEIEPELVIHCAASYKDPDRWHLDTETNIAGAINVAAVAKYHSARVIYFQTVLPPISSYAISKLAAEHYLRLSGVPLTVFRLAAVYGPRNLSGAIPTFYRQITAGEPCTVVEDATRDFVFIDDLVERVLERVDDSIQVEFVPGALPPNDPAYMKDGVIDVRTGKETPIRHIPQLIGEMLDIEPIVNLVPRRPDDVQSYEMGGVPRIGTPFIEGLRRAVNWYERNGVAETYTHLRVGA